MTSSESFTAFLDALALTGSAFRAYLRRRFKECSLDLTAEMMQVLYYLWGRDGVRQQEIANAINRDKASLTSLLDNLVRRELVERRADTQDRRNRLIVLTTKGRALELEVMPLVREMHEVAGRNLLPLQLRASLEVLEQISQNLTLSKR